MTTQAVRLGGTALAAVLLSTLLTAQRAHANTYYVAPTGDDAHAGDLQTPLRTIGRAVSLARAGDTIKVRGGTYRETVRFTTSGRAGEPITVEAFEKEAVTVSGADPVEGWRFVAKDRFATAMGPSLGLGDDQVFEDGVMLPELAFPHQGADPSSPRFAKVESCSIKSTTSGSVTTHEVTLRDGALAQVDHYWKGAVIHIHRFAHSWSRWVALTAAIQDSGPGWVTFSYEWQWGDDGEGPVSAGNPYFLTAKRSGIDEGGFTALTAPGEWARNDATGELELVAPSDPSSHRIEVKHRKLAFDLSGVSFVVVRGIAVFAAGIATDVHSTNDLLDGLTVTYPSHFTVINQGAAVTGWSAHVADTGVVLDGTGNTLRSSVIAFSAGNGVSVRGSGQTVQGCTIHDVDYRAVDCAAVYTSGADHKLVHNTMSASGRSLVVHRGTKNLKILSNELHHAGLQMTDLGATYAYGTDGGGTEIAYNWIHDVDASETAGPSSGIYLDNGTREFLVHHNVIWNAPAGIKLNAGKPGSGESGHFRVYNNTTYHTTNKSLVSGFAGSVLPSPIENNIFWNGADHVSGLEFSHDLESKDPGYVDAAAFDFRLQASSSASSGGVSIPGITDRASPSLGAYQAGEARWIPGAASAPVTTPPVTTPPVTTPPVTTPPPSGVRTILPGENAALLLNAATANEAFKLVPGAKYTFPSTQVSPRASGWSLDATGATIDWQIARGPGSPVACFRIATPGVKIKGGTWTTNAVLVEMFAASTVEGITLTNGATQAVKIDEQFTARGAGAVVKGCTFGITNSVTVYVTQPCRIEDNTFAGSVGEVPLRTDNTNERVSPDSVVITGNTIHSDGTNAKGCVELRQLGKGCELSGNTFHDYVRIGQGTATSRTQSCAGLLVKGNKWPVIPAKIQLDLLLMSGITVTIEGNDFLVNSTMETASHGGMSDLTFTGNRRHPQAANVTPRPKLWNPDTVPATCILKDGGGNVVVPFGE